MNELKYVEENVQEKYTYIYTYIYIYEIYKHGVDFYQLEIKENGKKTYKKKNNY